MVAIQLASARIGRVTGKGLTENFARSCPPRLVTGLVSLLVLANVINIGADLNAMGDAAAQAVGGQGPVWTVVFGLVSVTLQVLLPYEQYVSVL